MLVELRLVEQRHKAVLEVLAGATITDVALRNGVTRQAVHRWLRRHAYLDLAGLADHSSRPATCPRQMSAETEVRLLGSDDPNNLFPHEYVAALTHLGIINGTAPGRFSPFANLTHNHRPPRLWAVSVLANLFLYRDLSTISLGHHGHAQYGQHDHHHDRRPRHHDYLHGCWYRFALWLSLGHINDAFPCAFSEPTTLGCAVTPLTSDLRDDTRRQFVSPGNRHTVSRAAAHLGLRPPVTLGISLSSCGSQAR